MPTRYKIRTEADISDDLLLLLKQYVVQIKVDTDSTLLTTGNGKYIWNVPERVNGYNLTSAHCAVTTPSSFDTPLFSFYNLTTNNEMLGTPVTIDENEYDSYNAIVASTVINPLVSTSDRIRFDCGLAGTGTKGWSVTLTFTHP